MEADCSICKLVIVYITWKVVVVYVDRLLYSGEALSETETDELVKLLTQLKLCKQQNDAIRIGISL